ncbi:FMN-binding protein [Pseudarthrobacter sp. 1C304]|uniref:FMN-binding protein n=1 Tax=Pseudarthrobacter sp. 1C304 TaxID=3457438 RepID=UPI003FD5DE7C
MRTRAAISAALASGGILFDRKSVQISNRAAPLLRAAVLKTQSADVQTTSGATVTSDAYLTSLQAAIDAANL